MRSFSWVIILLALVLSWNYFERSNDVPWQKQYSVQLGLQEFISTYIQTELPEAKNISFVSLWSEQASDSRLKVHFDYFFDHPTSGDLTRMQLKGNALLRQVETESGAGWSLESVNIDNESLVYRDGSLIINDDVSDNDSTEN